MRLPLILLFLASVGCQCSRPPVKESPKQEGEDCGTDDSCVTGMCDGVTGFQPVCVRPCASGCHPDEVCVQFTPNRFACQPDPRKLCQPCELDTDCPYPSDKCVVVNGEHVCGRDCAFDQTCPTGYRCVNGLGTDGAPKPQQCTPINASCACLARGDFQQPCEVTNEFGTCRGRKQCDLVLNTVACDAATPAAEVCNAKDDNCDGAKDEGLGPVTCGVGECQRTVASCLDGGSAACAPGDPVAELCNGKDDDCDGVLDNGFAGHPHMSACGNVCDVGWVDLNQDVADGCEYQCTFASATDLPDLSFTDANCDGIDGEVNNGVFVVPAPAGDDNAAGTRAAPKATLGGAVSAAVLTNKRDVYLAQGVYDGPLELLGVTNLNVAGGYEATTWRRAFINTVAVDGGNPALTVDGSNTVLVQAISFAGANGSLLLPSAYGVFVRESQGVKLESLDVRAGHGADGLAGQAGDAGVAGVAGGQGARGCPDVNLFDDVLCYFLSGCDTRPSGGTAGTGSCGYSGGIGGQPTRGADGGTALPGQAAPNGTGSGGSPVPGGLGQGPVASPYAGGAGTLGLDGSNGAGATSAGAFGMNGFIPASGAAGTAGQPGKAGGGGGGGGGGFGTLLLCPAWGSGGGGGGGGGCGGPAGGGGLGGGASVGLFLYNSTVSGQSVVIRAGNGGRGGSGGPGGGGGLGGAGGTSRYHSDQGSASIGGAGGPGGNGGNGGHGGAGAGGSVYGLAKNAGSTWTPVSGTSFLIGTPGAAGSSPGNGGVAGTSGVILTY